MDTFTESQRVGTSTAERLATAEDFADDAIAHGENCVRDYPEVAIWSTFFGGLLLGGLLGFFAAGRRESYWRRSLRRKVDDVRHALNLS